MESWKILDKPDAELDRIWAEEALHRARACDEGRMKTVSFEEVFGDGFMANESFDS